MSKLYSASCFSQRDRWIETRRLRKKLYQREAEPIRMGIFASQAAKTNEGLG